MHSRSGLSMSCFLLPGLECHCQKPFPKLPCVQSSCPSCPTPAHTSLFLVLAQQPGCGLLGLTPALPCPYASSACSSNALCSQHLHFGSWCLKEPLTFKKSALVNYWQEAGATLPHSSPPGEMSPLPEARAVEEACPCPGFSPQWCAPER